VRVVPVGELDVATVGVLIAEGLTSREIGSLLEGAVDDESHAAAIAADRRDP
jgi:hypothetical protein